MKTLLKKLYNFTVEVTYPDGYIKKNVVSNGQGVVDVADVPARKAFKAMLNVSKATGNPRHYKDDLLLHDRCLIANYDPDVFVWVVREYGTHLYFAGSEFARVDLEYHVKASHYAKADIYAFYVWEDGKIRQVSPAWALTFYAERVAFVSVEE